MMNNDDLRKKAFALMRNASNAFDRAERDKAELQSALTMLRLAEEWRWQNTGLFRAGLLRDGHAYEEQNAALAWEVLRPALQAEAPKRIERVRRRMQSAARKERKQP